MKRYKNKTKLFASVVVSAILSLTFVACDDDKDFVKSPFDNTVYISAASVTDTENLYVKTGKTSDSKIIQSSLAFPVKSKEVHITYKVDPSLVANYGKGHYIECELLPENFYSFSETKAYFPAGEVNSTEVTINFKDLDDIEQDKYYVLPISLESSSTGIKILSGSRTIYYVVSKGAAITTVANIDNAYIDVDRFSNKPEAVNNLTEFTMEALINIHDDTKMISTVMGIEGYYLIRLGDAGFPSTQVQFASPGGNFPTANSNFALPKDQWTHIAISYSLATREAVIYVNGKEQTKGTVNNFGKIDLAYGNPSPDRGFYIGKSYDDNRSLGGEISECRIWSVVRTQEEIANNIYGVLPESENLVAYWKFDEGAGSTIKDHSQYGNKGTAKGKDPIKWLPVSLPAK